MRKTDQTDENKHGALKRAVILQTISLRATNQEIYSELKTPSIWIINLKFIDDIFFLSIPYNKHLIYR